MKLANPGKGFYGCLFFFICAGVVYGQFTARIPAIKAHAGIDDAQLGLVLLVYGIGSIAGFLGAPVLLRHMASRVLLLASALLLLLSLVGIAFAPDASTLCGLAAFFGLSTAIFDVCMNVQALLLEMASHRSRMAVMHACYSLGGCIGSLVGSLFAFASIGLLGNFCCVFLLLAPLAWMSSRHLLADVRYEASGADRRKSGIPFFIIFCGCMALGAFVTEGASAEWGGLLLQNTKHADAGTAALCFGALAAPMTIARLTEDKLREVFGDFLLVFTGSLLAFAGLGLVLLSPWPVLCLAGFSLVGLGLSPIMPIAISRAGTHGAMSPSSASALVSLLGYGGLLVVPPSLGWLAQHFGLETALLLPLGVCALLLVGSIRFKHS